MTTNKTPPFDSIKPEEKPDTLSERVNLEVLFRINGKEGLYYPKASPNKNGMVRMCRYGGNEQHTVHRRTIKGPLSNLVVYQNNGGKYALTDVLDNLEAFFNGSICYVNDSKDPNIPKVNWEKYQLMMVPDPDLDKFKPHHAKRIIGWYNELIQRSKIQNSK